MSCMETGILTFENTCQPPQNRQWYIFYMRLPRRETEHRSLLSKRFWSPL